MANLITPKFRASFVHLTKPHSAAPEAPGKYSVMVVLEKSNKEHMAFLETLKNACLDSAKEKFGAKIPKKLRLPFRDGDEEDRPEWEGCVVFNATASQDFKPGVVDKNLQAILDPDEIYSGMYCRASLRPYAWAHPTGGQGVSIGLSNVQKLADGEPFGGGVRAESEFKAWEDDDDDFPGIDT